MSPQSARVVAGWKVATGLGIAALLLQCVQVYKQFSLSYDINSKNPNPVELKTVCPIEIHMATVTAKVTFTRGGNSRTLIFSGASYADVKAEVDATVIALEGEWGTGVSATWITP